MTIQNLKTSVKRLQETLLGKLYYESKNSVRFRIQNYSSKTKSNIKLIEQYFWRSSDRIKDNEKKLQLILLINELKEQPQVKLMIQTTIEMEEILAKIKTESQIMFKKPKIPTEIQGEIYADIEELERCYFSKCYRSCLIICGRLLEVALHRKYYDTTNRDILEKNTGIGLGNLIKKLI